MAQLILQRHPPLRLQLRLNRWTLTSLQRTAAQNGHCRYETRGLSDSLDVTRITKTRFA